jgi:hypothetical protein
MLLAPIGKLPAAIDMDGLAIGIELDISGIGDLVWPAFAEDCPEEEEHAAATSASAPAPTAQRKTEPGRERPREADLNMPDLLGRARAR